MRKRRPPVDDERAALLADVVEWLRLASWQQRLHGDVLPSPYREVREAAERLLVPAELALVRGVVSGERDPAELPPAPGRDRHAHLDDRSRLLREAGVRFVDGVGWTSDPTAAPTVTRLDERRAETPRE